MAKPLAVGFGSGHRPGIKPHIKQHAQCFRAMNEADGAGGSHERISESDGISPTLTGQMTCAIIYQIKECSRLAKCDMRWPHAAQAQKSSEAGLNRSKLQWVWKRLSPGVQMTERSMHTGQITEGTLRRQRRQRLCPLPTCRLCRLLGFPPAQGAWHLCLLSAPLLVSFLG